MAILWPPDLSTHVAEIGDRHKELIQRVDSLLAAIDEGKGREEIAGLAQFLGDSMVFHFGNEERYMKQYGYQSATQHLAQHARFVRTFGRLKERLLLQGFDARLAEETRQLVVDWQINHIKYSDRALGLFLKRKLP